MKTRVAIVAILVVALPLAVQAFHRYAIAHRRYWLSRRQVPLCSVAQVDNIVHARVAGWDWPALTQVAGYDPKEPFSTVHVVVDEVLKGSLAKGDADVLLFLGVQDDGSSAEGQLSSDGGTSGYFFVENINGRMVVASEGFFRDLPDGGLIAVDSYPLGIDAAAFRSGLSIAGTSAGCSDPYYVPGHWNSLPRLTDGGNFSLLAEQDGGNQRDALSNRVGDGGAE